MQRVLIVGAGLTGSLCACLLRRALQDRVHIQVWDKSRGTGGRMCSARVSECVEADLGAQHVTATRDERRRLHSLYEELFSAEVLKPLSCSAVGLQQKHDSENFISPKGMSHIVKHFLHQSGAELHLSRQVTSLSRRGASWEVQFSEGQSESFDAVVLTMPVPQILQLRDMNHLLSGQQGALLSQVRFSSRFALVLFFPKDLDLDLDFGLRYESNSPWIRFLSLEHRKRGSDLSGLGPSLVVHSSVSFGSEFLDSDPVQVQTRILDELHRLLPHLPRPISIKTHRWRFSQMVSSVPGSPGHMTVCEEPLLLLGGDSFTRSNFNGCAESALSMLSTLTEKLH